MIRPEKRAAAARLVKTGRAVSLSREFPKTPAANNPTPAIHFMKRGVREGGGGSATDYYGISYHGQATTHLDALCHVWDHNGMWNGRNADDVITFDGATWGICIKTTTCLLAHHMETCKWNTMMAPNKTRLWN